MEDSDLFRLIDGVFATRATWTQLLEQDARQQETTHNDNYSSSETTS